MTDLDSLAQANSPSQTTAVGTGALPGLDSSIFDKIGNFLTSPKGIATLLGFGATAAGLNTPQGGGWQGRIPTNLVAKRTQMPLTTRTPFARTTAPVMGRRFFSDVSFAPATAAPSAPAPNNEVAPVIPAAAGGIMELAKGRYLRGSTDGMADKIPSSIDGQQPAALSHGEFVIPADVVSHLGNGNSDAGADVLYKMMDRVRQARTGTKQQGKQIKPEKFVPGGIAQLASGGAVQRFQTGGTPSVGVTSPTPAGVTTQTSLPTGTVQQGNLSNWIGDYVSDYLGRGLALSKEPFQAYTGPLTAGYSPIQAKAFTAAEGLGGTAFDPGKFMNPYISQALDPQLKELQRQGDINQQKLQSEFTRAGAFGGARDVIARTENMRNVMDKQAQLMGPAYKDAYDRAMDAFFKEQQQEIYDLAAMQKAGEAERGIEQEMINAEKAAFEQEREFPMQQVKFAQSLIGGLPTGTQSTSANLSALQQLGLSVKQAADVMDYINREILKTPQVTANTGAA